MRQHSFYSHTSTFLASARGRGGRTGIKKIYDTEYNPEKQSILTVFYFLFCCCNCCTFLAFSLYAVRRTNLWATQDQSYLITLYIQRHFTSVFPSPCFQIFVYNRTNSKVCGGWGRGPGSQCLAIWFRYESYTSAFPPQQNIKGRASDSQTIALNSFGR